MALPVINQDYKYVKVPLPSGKSIGVRGWKVKDEKELLFSLETVSDSDNVEFDKIKGIVSFLKECVDDKNKFDKLSENDIKRICIEIRKMSKGDEIEYGYECPHCKAKITDMVNLTKTLKVKSFDTTPFAVNDKLVLTFKDLEWLKTQDLYTRFSDSATKFAFYFIINSIDSLTYEGVTYTEFTEDEIVTFIDQLDPTDMDKLYKDFGNKGSSVSLDKQIKCTKCKEQIDVEFGDVLSFLVL